MILGLTGTRPIVLGAGALGLLLAAGSAFAAGDVVGGIPASSLVRLVFGTAVAIGVLLLGARWFVRYGGAQSVAAGSLRVVASLTVGQRERAVVVQVGDRQLLLGVAPGRVELLHELGAPLPVERHDKTAGVAPAWLTRVLGKSA
jgi:flagellar protein FliO/FliZ